MARAPFQVAILPFRRANSGSAEFAIFRRSDAGYWQVIAGGGEGDETAPEAAQREANEEARIPFTSVLFRLTTTASVPVRYFEDRKHWPGDLYVIPAHYFCVDATDVDIVISQEHSEFRWANFNDAQKALNWQSDAVALWELAERIQNGHL